MGLDPTFGILPLRTAIVVVGILQSIISIIVGIFYFVELVTESQLPDDYFSMAGESKAAALGILYFLVILCIAEISIAITLIFGAVKNIWKYCFVGMIMTIISTLIYIIFLLIAIVNGVTAYILGLIATLFLRPCIVWIIFAFMVKLKAAGDGEADVVDQPIADPNFDNNPNDNFNNTPRGNDSGHPTSAPPSPTLSYDRPPVDSDKNNVEPLSSA